MADPVFIGFAGHIGAGKTTAAKYLSSAHGFEYIRYSQVLQDWIAQDCLDKSRLQEAGWEVMSGGLQVELNQRLVAGLNHERDAAIDGLRHPIDFESLTSAFGAAFFLVFIEATQRKRFERLEPRFPAFGDFLVADAQLVESYIQDLKPFAKIRIQNDGSLEHLCGQLDAWLAQLRQRE